MMKQRIGLSDLNASVISMGAWAIGGGQRWLNSDDQESIGTILQAIDSGINLFDTAPGYGNGHSERVLGEALKSTDRSKVYISTKCGLWWHDDEGSFAFEKDGAKFYINLSERCIKQEIEFSLDRIGTDYIDLYMTHLQAKPPFLTPVSETMTTLVNLKKEGKIRSIGVSNVSPEQLEEYIKFGQVDLVQGKLSLLDRETIRSLDDICKKNNITFQAYSPVEQGLLTGKTTLDFVPEPGSARDGRPWWSLDRRPFILKMLSDFQPLCKKYDCSLINLNIAWLLCAYDNINVLCGARRPDQIIEIAQSDITLDASDIAYMEQRADDLIKMWK